MFFFSLTSTSPIKMVTFSFILTPDQELDANDEAWTLARKVEGRGQILLCYDKEDWKKQVPDWGTIIYNKLQKSQKYVVSEGRDFIKFLPTYL